MSRSTGRLAVLAAALLCAWPLAGAADTQAPTQDLFAPTAPARGWISLGLQVVRSEGSLDGGGASLPVLRNLNTDTQSLTIGIDYRVNARWSLHASLPFIRKQAENDVGAHNPAALARPRPESEFLDDGRFHGSWQDWQLGVAFHDQRGRFDLRYHAVLVYPSNDYTFFATAAVGQRLTRFRLGVDASSRVGRSNLHLGGGYSYEIVERVLGQNLDKHHLRLSARYDLSPAWSANLFADGRRGKGGVPSDFFPERPLGTERWYQHDRLLRQNFGFVGTGLTWRPSPDWALAASTSRMVWGDSIHDVKYAYDLQLRRAF